MTQKTEFTKIMLDNNMDKVFSEVEGAEKVKDLRHRSELLSADDPSGIAGQIAEISAKTTKSSIFTNPLAKVIAAAVVITLVIVTVIAINM